MKKTLLLIAMFIAFVGCNEQKITKVKVGSDTNITKDINKTEVNSSKEQSFKEASAEYFSKVKKIVASETEKIKEMVK